MSVKDFDIIQRWLEEAEAFVLLTGAGMGVDAGLPDYRGTGGQWGKVEEDTEKTVFEVVNPQNFYDNPLFAWRFFTARMKEYQTTEPHEGFQILLNWISKFNLDYFALTSNIDAHLQKAGFEKNRIREVHGSLRHFQCSDPAVSKKIWENDIPVDQMISDIEQGVFPKCPFTGLPARPNVYMFRDHTYVNTRSREQKGRLSDFLARNEGKKMVAFEIGSGPHVQTIRVNTRMLRKEHQAAIVRINPVHYKVRKPGIGIAKGALVALTELDKHFNA